jgi:RNA polymerase sigma factor for flagellar operon FliA
MAESNFDQYEEFLKRIVRKTMQAYKLPQSMKEDFMSAAYLGMIEASKRFDPTKGSNFESYAYMRVKGSILDVVRKEAEHTGLNFRSLRAIRSVHELEENLEKELSTVSNQDDALSLIMSFANSGTLCLRVHDLVEGDIANKPTEEATPADLVEQKDTLTHLIRVVKKLPEKERFIVEQHYFEGKSFAEIVEDNSSLSKSWVSRLHTRALEKLSILLRDDKCKELIEEIV